ncbi:MAG: sensor histidine kinase [Spirochaetales bacterium]|nr:sensor histidine kinase [Spirochaetales bacterium]
MQSTSFDPRTVLLSLLLTQFVLALFLASAWVSHRRLVRGLGEMAAGYALFAIGEALVAFRGLIPDFASIIVGSPLMPIGFWLLLNGIERSAGFRRSIVLPLALTLADLSGALVFLYLRDSYTARALIFSGANAVLSAHAAMVLARTIPSLEGPRRKLRVAGVAALVANALAAFGRVSSVAIVRAGAPTGLLQAGPAETAFLFAGLVFFTVFGFLVVQSLNERIAGSLRAAAEERSLLLREMHHRIKNDLSLVESLARLQEGVLADGPAADAFAAFGERVRSIGMVHDRLSRESANGKVEAGAYLRDLVSTLGVTRGDPSGSVRVSVESCELALPAARAVTLGLLVNELGMNALKHAFPEGRSGRIAVRLERAPSGRLALSVEDDGQGVAWPPDKPGLGSAIVEALCAQLGGKLAVISESGRGSRFSVEFPAAEPAESITVR